LARASSSIGVQMNVHCSTGRRRLNLNDGSSSRHFSWFTSQGFPLATASAVNASFSPPIRRTKNPVRLAKLRLRLDPADDGFIFSVLIPECQRAHNKKLIV